MRSLDTNSANRGDRLGSCEASDCTPASICCMDCIIPGRPPENADETCAAPLPEPATEGDIPIPVGPVDEESGSGGREVIG